ncbi:hypothetical protein KIN20_028456 [Parelaphostrongylus tenuis]|uniref:Uncharacterized protein n=1 Tax=Parelaphostrongylus tenuis TaxID=148309 RepID=A0AAD5R136_PARTN|nr:hypothetical protein KIN20_028456 [Parelaphostrongylus tenuis]
MAQLCFKDNKTDTQDFEDSLPFHKLVKLIEVLSNQQKQLENNSVCAKWLKWKMNKGEVGMNCEQPDSSMLSKTRSRRNVSRTTKVHLEKLMVWLTQEER